MLGAANPRPKLPAVVLDEPSMPLVRPDSVAVDERLVADALAISRILGPGATTRVSATC